MVLANIPGANANIHRIKLDFERSQKYFNLNYKLNIKNKAKL